VLILKCTIAKDNNLGVAGLNSKPMLRLKATQGRLRNFLSISIVLAQLVARQA